MTVNVLTPGCAGAHRVPEIKLYHTHTQADQFFDDIPEFATRNIPAYARADITWWSTYANSWNGVQLLETPQPTVLIVGQWVWEASSTTGGFRPDVPAVSATGTFNSKKYTPCCKLFFAGAIYGSTVTLSSTWIMLQ